MALSDAIILETVVSPVANGTIIRIQLADAPLQDGVMDADAGRYPYRRHPIATPSRARTSRRCIRWPPPPWMSLEE